jgi:elongation factor Ts
MNISAQQVAELREKTGVGMMDCKKALLETGGDVEKAIDYLRTQGFAKAAKRAGRATSQGLVEAYIHPGAQVGVLVELDCETDFVARNDEFKTLARDIALHVAASNPLAISGDELDPTVLEKEREIYRAQTLAEGKPESMVDKIVEGRLQKYKKEVALLDQPFVKNPNETVGDLVKSKIATFGENITVRRIARFQIGA